MAHIKNKEDLELLITIEEAAVIKVVLSEYGWGNLNIVVGGDAAKNSRYLELARNLANSLSAKLINRECL